MKDMVWTKGMILGNEVMDTEHEHLFRIYNEFCHAVRSNEPKEVLYKGLSDLVNHSVEHFKHEEILMMEARYPRYAQHREIHSKLLSDIGDLTLRFGDDILKVTSSVLLYIYSWLLDHIQGEDKNFCIWLARYGS